MSIPFRSTLPALLAVALTVAALQSLLVISRRTSATREQNEAKVAELAALRTELGRRQRASTDAQASERDLTKIDLAAIAPADNAMEWAYDQMRKCAREADLKLVNVTESNAGIPDPRIRDATPWFRPYRLSVELSGSPEAAVRFIRCIEESNSLVVLNHFSVLAMRHGEPPMIMVTLEWPAWYSIEKQRQVSAKIKELRTSTP